MGDSVENFLKDLLEGVSINNSQYFGISVCSNAYSTFQLLTSYKSGSAVGTVKGNPVGIYYNEAISTDKFKVFYKGSELKDLLSLDQTIHIRNTGELPDGLVPTEPLNDILIKFQDRFTITRWDVNCYVVMVKVEDNHLSDHFAEALKNKGFLPTFFNSKDDLEEFYNTLEGNGYDYALFALPNSYLDYSLPVITK